MPLVSKTALTLCLFLLLAPQANAQVASTLQGKVIGITDGDSIIILDTANRQRSIRLQGIDSPEIQQIYGEQAKQNLANMIFGRQVVVEYSKRDNYGHILGKVLTLDGRDINLEQIRDGMAWHYKQYEEDQTKAERRAYSRAEREAREEQRGLWAEQLPTPPWVWRRTPRVRERQPVVVTFGKIIGNNRTRIYHRPDCPNYNKVAQGNKIEFNSVEEAERAGYRPAKNCP